MAGGATGFGTTAAPVLSVGPGASALCDERDARRQHRGSVADRDSSGSWEGLLETQSEYIANLQRMLQSACQNAAVLAGPETSFGQPPPDPLPTRVFGGAVERTALTFEASRLPSGGVLVSAPSVGAHAPTIVSVPAATSVVPQHSIVSTAGFVVTPPREFVPTSPAIVEGNWTRSATTCVIDCEGSANCSMPSPPLSPIAKGTAIPQPAVPAAPLGSPGVALVLAANGPYGSTARVESVASEVLRLRLLRSQHEELRAQLGRMEAQLRRLSPQAVFQFRSYLERQLRPDETRSTMQLPQAPLQEAVLRLLECLCAVCHIELGQNPASEHILIGARKLLRDPHSFTSKLSSMPHVSCEEAKGLAPFLLTSTPYRRVKEKEVNACYETFHAWLSAFYLYSVVSDQVVPTVQELDRQEWLLRRLNGQDEAPAQVPIARYPAVVGSSACIAASTPCSSGPTGLSMTSTPAVAVPAASSAVAPRSSVLAAVGATAPHARGTRGGVASPLSRSRTNLHGLSSSPGAAPHAHRSSPMMHRGSTGGLNPIPWGANGSGRASPQHRSSSGGAHADAGRGASATATAASSAAALTFGAPGPGAAGAAAARQPRVGLGFACSSSSGEARGSSIHVAAGGSELGASGLTRAQSEQQLGKSPRGCRKAAIGRPQPSSASSCHSQVSQQRHAERSPGRAISPPRGFLTSASRTAERAAERAERVERAERAADPTPVLTVHRMSSAPSHPTTSLERPVQRAVAVRTKVVAPRSPVASSGGRHSAVVVPGRPGSTGGVAAAAVATTHSRPLPRPMSPDRGAGPRPMSPDKGAGAPRADRCIPDATPRSSGLASSACGETYMDRLAGNQSSTDDEEDETSRNAVSFGPHRRRLTRHQYEALVQCAQHVVAVSSVSSSAPEASVHLAPARVVLSSGQGERDHAASHAVTTAWAVPLAAPAPAATAKLLPAPLGPAAAPLATACVITSPHTH